MAGSGCSWGAERPHATAPRLPINLAPRFPEEIFRGKMATPAFGFGTSLERNANLSRVTVDREGCVRGIRALYVWIRGRSVPSGFLPCRPLAAESGFSNLVIWVRKFDVAQ